MDNTPHSTRVRIAFVTSSAHPSLTADDLLAVGALRAEGIEVEPAIWSDRDIDWDAFDAVVVRSTWDYHHRASEFRHWLIRLEEAGARVWNPPHVLRWNMEKTYLRDLDRAGVPVVPTVWVPQDAAREGLALVDERGWDDVVIKPVVSATAFRTMRVSRVQLDEALADLVAAGDAMIQPFIAEIEREGEWSLMFIDGEFSHAVRKRPSVGDFRVQTEFGGTSTADGPPASVIAAAERALAAAPQPWLYARVDGIDLPSGLLLVELEMLEPSLFLATAEDAGERFARAISRVARDRAG